jgi:hypothetical protein
MGSIIKTYFKGIKIQSFSLFKRLLAKGIALIHSTWFNSLARALLLKEQERSFRGLIEFSLSVLLAYISNNNFASSLIILLNSITLY